MAELQGQVTASARLVLKLSVTGLAAWQQDWLACELPPRPGTAAAARWADLRDRTWPLGDRLGLSVYMVLQWAHARCHTWLQRWPEPATETDDCAAAIAQELQTAKAALILPLLLRSIESLDQIAVRADQPGACVRQAYTLAETIYELDARMAEFWRADRSDRGLLAATATIQSAQKVLALVLQGYLGVQPLAQL